MYSNVLLVLKAFRIFHANTWLCFEASARTQDDKAGIGPQRGIARHSLALLGTRCCLCGLSVVLCGSGVQVLGLIIRHCVAAFLPDATWLQTFQRFAHVCSIRMASWLTLKAKFKKLQRKTLVTLACFVTVSGCRLYFGSLVGDPWSKLHSNNPTPLNLHWIDFGHVSFCISLFEDGILLIFIPCAPGNTVHRSWASPSQVNGYTFTTNEKILVDAGAWCAVVAVALLICCHSLSFFIHCVFAELGAGCRLRPLQFPAYFVDPGGWRRLQHLEHSDGHCQPVVNASTCCIRLLGPGDGVRRSGLWSTTPPEGHCQVTNPLTLQSSPTSSESLLRWHSDDTVWRCFKFT